MKRNLAVSRYAFQMRFRCVSMSWISRCNTDAHQIRIQYAYGMRIQNSKRMRISECVLDTHYMHIQDTFIGPNSAISKYAFQMHFRCVSKILKRFDAKLETFQMRFVFTGNLIVKRICSPFIFGTIDSFYNLKKKWWEINFEIRIKCLYLE